MKKNSNSLPIAYSIARRGKKVLNRQVSEDKADHKRSENPEHEIPHFASPAMNEYMAGKAKQLAGGGMINEMEDMDDSEMDGDAEEHYASIADAILSKKRKAMADGGQVDLEENSEESTADAALKFRQEANLKEQYDDSQLEAQPEDSNEHGDEREEESENEHDGDLVSSIRKKMKSKK